MGMALMSKVYARVDKAPTFRTDSYPFVENRGQLADPEGRPLTEAYFTFEAPGMRGYVTRWGLTLYFYRLERDKVEREDRHWVGRMREGRERESEKVAWERVDVELVGGCVEGGRIRKGMPSVWGRNYYLGHCPQGILGVRGYGEVVVEGVWPGVDWVLRYDERVGGVKQEFVVQGGYRWDGVRLRIWSRGGAEVSGGRLRVRTAYGEIVEEGLVGYYGSERVGVRYRVLSERWEGEVKVVEVGYEVSGVPEVGEKTLVIDPVLQWGTYFGGSDWDEARSVAVDGSGNVFVVGWTASTSGFPLANPGGGAYFDNTYDGGDAFIAKFSGSNLGLLWSTYFGGSGDEEAASVAVDGSGNVFVVGETSSSDFPLVDPGGGAYFDNTYNGGDYDAFIAKFSGSNLSLLWSTYFGGDDEDVATSVAVDGSGNVFMVGYTQSTSGFPLANPGGGAYYDNTYNGAPWGEWGDPYIAKFSGSNLSLVWSTYFGGGGADIAASVTVDEGGNVFVVGWTTCNAGFPLANPGGGAYFDATYDGGRDVFIAKFLGSNLSLVWSTYYGGRGEDYPWGDRAIVAGAGFIAVGAATESSDFPVGNHPSPCPGGFYQGTRGGSEDLAILTFGLNGVPLWRTFYGGPGNDGGYPGVLSVAVYSTYLYVVGTTRGSLPASHLPNPGGDAYYDNTHNGNDDVVLLRFDYANCQLSGLEVAVDERGSWEAWWDGGAVRVAGVDAAGWYSVVGMDGRIVGRWYVEGEGGALEGPWSRGLYVVHREGTMQSRRVYVGP
jgi:hypothetical protein